MSTIVRFFNLAAIFAAGYLSAGERNTDPRQPLEELKMVSLKQALGSVSLAAQDILTSEDGKTAYEFFMRGRTLVVDGVEQTTPALYWTRGRGYLQAVERIVRDLKALDASQKEHLLPGDRMMLAGSRPLEEMSYQELRELRESLRRSKEEVRKRTEYLEQRGLAVAETYAIKQGFLGNAILLLTDILGQMEGLRDGISDLERILLVAEGLKSDMQKRAFLLDQSSACATLRGRAA